MGIPLKPRRSAATTLLLLLPIIVLLVPQGTVQRSLIPEAGFVVALVLSIVVVAAQASWSTPQFALRRELFNPLLLVGLTYLLLLNPIWSVWNGNDLLRVVMTTLPFAMIGVYYLLALRWMRSTDVLLLIIMLELSGALVGLAVIVNYFVSDLSGSAMRSTGIEGNRTLTLPILPMCGVLLATHALTLPSGWKARIASTGALLIFVAMVMTVTRAMLLAFFAGWALAVLIVLVRGRSETRRRAITRIAMGVAGATLLTSPYIGLWLDRIDPTSNADVGTILGRLDEYTAFAEAFLSSPILGTGMGRLISYPSEFDWTLRDSGITVCHSHLFFLAGTTGIVGLATYYGILAAGIFGLLKRAKNHLNDAVTFGTLAGASGALVAGLLFTMTSTTFTTLSYNLSLAILLFCARTNWERG